MTGSGHRTAPATERSPRGGEVDIGQWLRGLGLQSYEQAFRDNGIRIPYPQREVRILGQSPGDRAETPPPA